MVRPKFNYNDIVCVKPGITAWIDVPIRRTSGPRVGERACVFGITADREPGQLPQFPIGVIYGVEFEEGDAIEVHEDDLQLIEPSRDAASPNVFMTVKILSPNGAITPTGPWSVGSRAGDFVFVAGMRGIDPKTNVLIEGEEARIRQAFVNMLAIAASEGAGLKDCARLVTYVTDMGRLRPWVNKVQEEIWAGLAYPPRTIVQVSALNQNDIFEVDGTFFAPVKP